MSGGFEPLPTWVEVKKLNQLSFPIGKIVGFVANKHSFDILQNRKYTS